VRCKKDIVTRNGYRPKSVHKKQLYLLQGLPGVGVKLAKNLLSHFASVGAVMQATESALSEVEGLGKIKAKQITVLLECKSD